MRAAAWIAAALFVFPTSASLGAEPCDPKVVKTEVDLNPVKAGLQLAITVVAPTSNGWDTGTSFRLSGGGLEYEGKLEATPALPGIPATTTILKCRALLDPHPGVTETVDVMTLPSAVTLDIGECELDAQVTVNGGRQLKSAQTKELAIGPVMSETETDLPAESDANGTAFRFRGKFETTDALGGREYDPNRSRWPLALSLRASVDTTTEDSAEFVDDNRLALRFGGGRLRAGQLLRVMNLGVEAEYARAFHSRDRTLDGTVTVDLRFPFVRAANLLATEAPFLAPPLTATLSYGYRDARHTAGDDDTSTTDANGQVFKAQLGYNLFLVDHYRLTLGYDYTHLDPNDEDVVVDRNQRMYRASIAYLPSAGSRFEAVASYEDGSSGPVVRDVKQCFLGVALRRLGVGGSAASTKAE